MLHLIEISPAIETPGYSSRRILPHPARSLQHIIPPAFMQAFSLTMRSNNLEKVNPMVELLVVDQ